MKIIELFGGIGACTQALNKVLETRGGNQQLEILDYVEIDNHAVKSYNAINGTNFESQDITTWNKHFDDVDLIMHGSPCQDFSVAGKQAGGDKDSGTRSSLMYETLRIVKDIKPKYVVWENVKNLLCKTHIHNFNAYLEEMESLGYKNYYKVLNARDFEIPQNRERIFTISVRNDIEKDFNFPNSKELKLSVKDILEENVDEYFYKICPSMIKALDEGKVKDITNNNYSQTVTTKQQRWNNAGLIKQDGRYRYLTPRECWRLMGFSEDSFNKASEVCNISNLYKQAGNSIVVNVLYNIFNNLI